MTNLERRALLRCLGMERPCTEYATAKLIRNAMNETGEYIDRQKLIDDFRTEGACFVYGDCVPGIISRIRAQPVIDPETLPIVQQLREDLERVMKERDAAVSALKFEHDCNFCANDCVNPEQDYCALCHSKECMCRTCKDGSNWAFQFPQKEE